ncbi:MAG: response regulator [Rugosibacter sp.]|nr:MAG: response regulator [Rugosibacter sp.]
MATALDIGPLSWVKGEIDLALDLTKAELIAYATHPEDTFLKKAFASLHQAHGALAIVGLDGVTEFSRAIEQLLQVVNDKKVADASAAVRVIQEGIAALSLYLDELMAGGAHQSLKLFPDYRALVVQQGLPEPAPSELFFPDLTQRPPRREREPEPLTGEPLALRLRAARMGFERGLLKWIKGDAKGISEMKASLTLIELTRTTPAARAYWWVSLGVLDALGAGGLPEVVEARRFLLRLASQIKKLVEGVPEVPAPFLREALYLAATANNGHAALAVVQAAYRLDSLIPTAPVTVGRRDEHIRRLRELVAAARQDWVQLCGGAIAALLPFHEHVTWLADEAAATHEFSYVQLTAAICEQADLLRRNPMRHNDTLAVEMTSVLHLAESALDHFSLLGDDFAGQVNVVVARLSKAASGEMLEVPDTALVDAIPQRAPGRLLLESVANEIHINLGAIEQILDSFFRDSARKDRLNELQAPLKQVEDALVALDETRAIEVLDECAATFEQFAEPDFIPQREDFDRVAQKLLSIGFFVSQLALGPANPESFFGTATESIATEDSAQTATEKHASVDADADAGAPSDAEADALDAELRNIFTEEARDILVTFSTHLPRLHAVPDDKECLVILRRGFHTLKGSGRMVGLHDLGEAAWSVEQVMNRWLDEARAVTPDLLAMLDRAVTVFQQWVTPLGLSAGVPQEVSDLLQRCAALGGATQESLLGGVPPEPTFVAPVRPMAPGGGVPETITGPEFSGASLPPAPLSPAEIAQTVEPVAEITAQTAVPAATESAEVFAFPELPPVRVGTVEVSPALYSLYLNEARGYSAMLQAQLGQEAVPRPEVIRAAHTLASISAATGFLPIHHLAHALENALMRFEQLAIPPSDTQRFVFARCAGALAGMLGAVAERRMPGEEGALAATLNAMMPIPKAQDAPAEASAAAQVMDEQQAHRHIPQNEEEIDSHLLAVFLDESTDLVREIGEHLRAWRAVPEDVDVTHALARALHTLKGSARMAGAMACGELLHTMETRIEDALIKKHVSPDIIDGLEISLDHAASLLDGLRHDGLARAAGFTPDSSSDTREQAILVNGEVAAPSAVPPAGILANGNQPVLRVRADLVDQWVNDAGEISIARTRIESELRELKATLLDLTESVLRLRGQLREVEIQAESQMQSQQALAADHAQRFDPLEFDRFTRFQEVTRMMAESVNDVATVQHNLLLNLDHANAALMAQARLNRDLSQHLMRARMMPFDSLAERLHRVVRQAAKDADTRVNLDILNGQTEMDRSVLEKMAGPIEHLLRNSIAHGIEAKAQRLAVGKPEIGQITLTLVQESNDVVISLADDGAGIDYARIQQQAVAQGLLSSEAGSEAIDEAKLSALIFHPGFSTASEVTTLSGRGVGLGVVKNETATLGGRIDVRSIVGKGTTFLLTLPQTMAVTQVVMVVMGNRHYAIPSAMVEQVNELKPGAIAAIREAKGNEWQGAHYPWHYLPQLLGERHAVPVAAQRTWLLQIKSGTGRIALEVDGLVGNQEIVVKPIGPQLARIPWLIGATVLADGEVVLLVNPVVLLAEAAEHSMDIADIKEDAPAQPEGALVMVVDDSLTVRKVTSRLLDRQGYRVVTAKDGVDALEQLREILPDVMLIDIEMPRMDGFDLSQTIRADARLAGIPLIAITSRTADKHRQHALDVGINHYLGKPYNEDQLLALIAGYCDQKTMYTGTSL